MLFVTALSWQISPILRSGLFVPPMLSEFLHGLTPPLLLDRWLQSTPFGSYMFVSFLHQSRVAHLSLPTRATCLVHLIILDLTTRAMPWALQMGLCRGIVACFIQMSGIFFTFSMMTCFLRCCWWFVLIV